MISTPTSSLFLDMLKGITQGTRGKFKVAGVRPQWERKRKREAAEDAQIVANGGLYSVVDCADNTRDDTIVKFR